MLALLQVTAGFAPWIVYWSLLGNTSFRTAVLLAVLTGIAVTGVPLVRGRRPFPFEVGSVLALLALLILTVGADDRWLERWIQPLSNAGLLITAAVLQLTGRPFTLPYARAAVPADVARAPGFRWVNAIVSGVWVVAFALMTAVSVVPPAVQGAASVRDGGTLLSVVGYWVIPFVLMGLAGAFSAVFPSWLVARLQRPAPAEVRPPRTPPPAWPPAEAAGWRLDLQPSAAPADAPVVVRSTGELPDGDVCVTVRQPDAEGGLWTTSARRSARDLRSGLDVSELVGLLRPVGVDPRDVDVYTAPVTYLVEVLVTASGRQAAVGGRRWHVAPDVVMENVTLPGVAGRLFLPGGRGRRPAVLLLPGSEGGLDSQSANAGLLAAHGYVALVAATHGAAGLPSQPARIPLEAVATAAEYLARRPEVDGDRLAGMAISKGAEALLAAAAIADLPLRALVLISPSNVVWQAIGPNGPLPGTSSWTWEGQELPFRPLDGDALMPQLARNAVLPSRAGPLRLLPAYQPVCTADEAAVIPAEQVAAPLLCVAGADDLLWPSAPMARVILARRDRPEDALLVLPGTGHLLGLPHRPVTAVGSGGIAFGGTPADVARGQVRFERRLLTFLRETVSAPTAAAIGPFPARPREADPDSRPAPSPIGDDLPAERGTSP